MPGSSHERRADIQYRHVAGDLRRYVHSQLRSIKSGHDIDAEDVVQEAFLRTWSASNEGNIRNGKSYLFRTARNLVIDIGRRRRAQPVDNDSSRLDEPAVKAAATTTLSPERCASGQQDLDIVLNAIAKLPEKCRGAFYFQRSTGFSYAKVGRALEMSESMVQKHMSRALLAVHEALR